MKNMHKTTFLFGDRTIINKRLVCFTYRQLMPKGSMTLLNLLDNDYNIYKRRFNLIYL